MTDSNRHNLPINFLPLVAPEAYLSNQDKISELKAIISTCEGMNEAGKKSHDELTRELEQKIREGEYASKLLSQLRTQPPAQLPLPMLIQRPAIDYFPSTSGIEEVPNYNPGSGHPQQVRYDQFQATNSNRQTHNFMGQPVAISSYQQYNPQQWTSGNANGGQLQQYSQHLQQPTMQNTSSRHFSFGPPSDSQQLPPGQDRGNGDNHSRPVAPMHDQSVVSSRQEPLHYGNLGSSQGQRHTIPAQASGPSSHMSRPQYALQSSSIQNLYPPQTRAAASDATHSQMLPHKTTDIANQSQPTTTPAVSRPVVWDPQPNASSSNSAVGTSPNRIVQDNPNGDRPSFSNRNTSHAPHPPSLMPTTLPSMNMSYTQFIRELREAVKNWEVKVPPNSYVDHPSNYFRVHKDLKGVTHIIILTHGQSRAIDLDRFCDWIKSRNTTTSVTPALPEISQTAAASKAQKATPLTAHKVIPSTLHSASVQTTSSISQLQSATPHRPHYLQPGASSSEQTPPTMSPSMPNHGIASLNRQMATSSPSASSTSMSVPHLDQPPLPSAQTPSFVSIPKTPSRQSPTIVNGVPRSAKQADKKSLASHILFGLGKRPREPNTSPSALTEPKSKRHAQGPSGQVGVGVSPSASYIVGQASRNPNPVQITPYGALTASSSLQQPPQYVFTPPTIPQETQQISPQGLSVSRQQQLVNAPLEMPSTSRVAEVLQVSDHQTSLSLQDAGIVSSDPGQKIILDDRPVTSPGHYVPLATSPTLPSPAPLLVPVVVSSEHSSEVNEQTTQPVASSAVKQPQPDTSTTLQHSFTGVPTPFRPSPQTPQKNQPLFLPSPVSSPGIVENDDTSAPETRQSFDPHRSSSSVGRKNRAYVLLSRKKRAYVLASPSLDLVKSPGSVRRKYRAFVLAPPRPPYLVKYLKKRMTSRSSVSTSVAGEEDFYNATKSHSPSYDHERQAVQLASTRLQELSCKWNGCSVKMNSIDALICHLNRQHKPSSTSHSNSFLCRWSQCGRRCNIHEKHLEKHASLPLNCPHKDCEESFRSAPPLWKHMRIEHKNDTVKPSARPSYADINLPDTFLGVMPSFMITTREVNPEEISSARHALLGPRVLRNIAGLARERSRNKLKRTVRSSNGDIIADEDTSNDYDFLTTRPTRYSSQLSQSVDMRLEDLDSENISRMVDEGLTLWGGDSVSASDE